MTHLWFFIANGFVSFLASLAAFIVWHHWDVAERWDARGVRKARDHAVREGEPTEAHIQRMRELANDVAKLNKKSAKRRKH